MSSYLATAEFYDLLHADTYRRLAAQLLDRWLGTPHLAALDVGAGTGIATMLLAQRCNVPVHAIEPAAPMRIALLTGLAAHPELVKRVTVHAGQMHTLGLQAMADFAICINVAPNLSPTERLATFTAVSEALVPGGRLVLQAPSPQPPPTYVPLPSRQVGGDVYTGEVKHEQVDIDRLRSHFTYQIRRDRQLLRETSESFDTFLATRDQIIDELHYVGLSVTDEDNDILITYTKPK